MGSGVNLADAFDPNQAVDPEPSRHFTQFNSPFRPQGGPTTAPVDTLVPCVSHKLNDPNSERSMLEAMVVACNNPAFDAKWGDVLRAKHPALAKAQANARASNALNGRAADTASTSLDGNFTPKGFEQTPFDPVTQVQRGEAQRSIEPRTVAGLDGLLSDLFAKMKALAGGLDRLRPAVARKPVTTTGIRGADSKRAAADAARNAERRKVAEQIEAAYEVKRAVGDSSDVRTYWDPALGVYRLV
ncbi:hypothetical protein PWR63_19365 [Paraburkholderia sp. A2WS-5]|uniref:hypothetical protein n=1 Tax=unclassified Paraburkholderia TaxID=2615204 RepID=UPI003B7C103E